MRAHIPHRSCLLHQYLQGDLALSLARVCTNDTLVDRVGVLVVLLCIAWNRIRSGRVPCLRPTSARCRACSQVAVSVLHVGLESVEFVCGMSSSSVMQDRPLKSPPSVATLDSLFNSFTHCASTLCQSFSCCKFWTRRSNQVPLD